MRRLAFGLGNFLLGAILVVACSSEESGTSSGTSGTSGTTGGTSGTSGTSGTTGGTSGASGDSGTSGGDSGTDAPAGPFTLTSTAFANDAAIPLANARCPMGTAGNQSPPLAWSNPPAGTQSFAIVMRDPDAPNPANNYHWVIYDIPATTTSLPGGVSAVAAPPAPAGAKQTYWSFGNDYSYQGPCPPALHSYVFTIYSFSTPTLAVPSGTTNPATADAIIQANKTGSAQLTGKYQQ